MQLPAEKICTLNNQLSREPHCATFDIIFGMTTYSNPQYFIQLDLWGVKTLTVNVLLLVLHDFFGLKCVFGATIHLTELGVPLPRAAVPLWLISQFGDKKSTTFILAKRSLIAQHRWCNEILMSSNPSLKLKKKQKNVSSLILFNT